MHLTTKYTKKHEIDLFCRFAEIHFLATNFTNLTNF